MDLEYLSESFHELNIAVNYEDNLIHVYRTTHVIYPKFFEKVRNNWELRGNVWHEQFVVGATTTATKASTSNIEGPERPTSSASQRAGLVNPRHHPHRLTTEDRNRQSLNDMMQGGMSGLQRTSIDSRTEALQQ